MCLVHCPDSSDCERHLVPDDGPQQLHQPDHLRGLLLLRETSQSFCQHKHHTGHDPLLQQATTIGQEVIWSFQPRRNTRKSERCNDREAESLNLTSSLSPSLQCRHNLKKSIWTSQYLVWKIYPDFQTNVSFLQSECLSCGYFKILLWHSRNIYFACISDGLPFSE